MTKVTKTTSASKSTTLKRKINFVQNQSKVKKVDPINKSYNDLISKDNNASNYFDSVFQLTEEYRNYYHNEQQLEEDIKKFMNDDKSLLIRLLNLITSYNKTIDSLVVFDYTFHTNYIEKVSFTINKDINKLNSIGIFKDNFSKLEINKRLFIKSIADSKNPTEELFNPLRDMIIEIYKILVRVKVPSNNKGKSYSKESLSSFFQGNVIDTKK